MKQIIFIIVFLLTSVMSINAENIYEGSWKVENKNIVYTFVNDTLYVDEVGNEGDVYTYYIDGNTCVAKKIDAPYPDEDMFIFNIQQIMMNTIEIVFFNDENKREDLILHKLDNYNFKKD